MPIGIVTGKQAIVSSLEELMTKQSLDKITVTNICDNCGINRQVFYYYFKDKYDVVIYIFKSNQNETIRSALKEHSWGETTVLGASAIMEKKDFFINALRANDVNSLSEYLFDYIMQIAQSIVLSHIDANELTTLQQYTLRQYVHGLTGILKEWYLKDNMKQSPQVIADSIVANIPTEFKRCFENINPDLLSFPE